MRLAVESWVDGCLGEGAAAACAGAEARLASEGSIAATQQIIAGEEASHAELAWDVLDWTVAVGGQAVRAALQAVAEATPSPPNAHSAAANEGRGLERFGILSDDHRHEVVEKHRSAALDRLARHLS